MTSAEVENFNKRQIPSCDSDTLTLSPTRRVVDSSPNRCTMVVHSLVWGKWNGKLCQPLGTGLRKRLVGGTSDVCFEVVCWVFNQIRYYPGRPMKYSKVTYQTGQISSTLWRANPFNYEVHPPEFTTFVRLRSIDFGNNEYHNCSRAVHIGGQI